MTKLLLRDYRLNFTIVRIGQFSKYRAELLMADDLKVCRWRVDQITIGCRQLNNHLLHIYPILDQLSEANSLCQAASRDGSCKAVAKA